jgi:aconitate hydratase
MVFDLELIKKIYSELPAKVAAARKLVGKPLTLSEKIFICTFIRAFTCFTL